MSSEQVSLVAEHPFVRKFVFAILRNIGGNSIPRGERYVVHADLVPKVSARVMKSIMDKPMVVSKKPMVVPRVPIRRAMPPRVPIRRAMPQKVAPLRPQITHPPIKSDVGLSQDYGKIMPLLNDASVSTIECQGAGVPLMVVRAGQRQSNRMGKHRFRTLV